MDVLSAIKKLSLYPIVDLNEIKLPIDGIIVSVNQECRVNFFRDNKCKDHYEILRNLSNLPDAPMQCPYGFCSYAFGNRHGLFALTGVIPFPRIGGKDEKRLSDNYKNLRVTVDQLKKASDAMLIIAATIEKSEDEAIQKYSMALHEIRKLNRAIKQTAERKCIQENPKDPDLANPEFVHIWKTSEIMSQQFNIIEILANENLTKLPLKTDASLYRIFDKCVHIYRPIAGNRKFKL